MNLRREYEQARIDESLDVICIFKELQIRITQKEAKKYFDNICDYTLKYLDDKIRAIRFFVEASVRFKKLSVKMESEKQIVEETKVSAGFSSMISIDEAMTTKTIQMFSCTDENIRKLNIDIMNTVFPLSNKLLNSCHIYYDLSYHQSNFVSVTLLITCLEILFLDEERGTMKEPLSKRCSVFLFDTKTDQIDCFNKLVLCYEKRNDFVHGGNYSSITKAEILFLRECVRQALIKHIHTGIDKKSTIKSLKRIISGIDYLKIIKEYNGDSHS